MKYIITLLFICLSGPLLIAQELVNNVVVNKSGLFNNSDLTIHNSSVRNGNLSFEGNIASYGELPDIKGVNALTGTWCFIVNVTHATTGPGQSIIGKTEAIGSYAGLHVFEDSGRIALQIKNYTNSQTLTIKSDYVAGTGNHFITVTYENNKSVKLYIDGVLKKEAKPPYFTFSKNPMRLGCSMDPFWKPFDGDLTNIEIYSYALNDAEIACLSNARKIDGDQFFIYPNPAQNSFNIELPNPDHVRLVLVDMNGKEVYSEDIISSKTITVNTESLASGVYYIHVSGAQNYGVQKLVLSKN